MKNILMLGLLLVLATTGFNGRKKGETLTLVPGTYGICAGASQVTLRIDADNTFIYIDNTTKNKLDIRGRWIRSGNTTLLEGKEGKAKIHDRWKIDGSTGCLRSRKGMEWRRLCLVSE